MNQFNILTVFGIAVIMLLVGVAIGPVAFPVTKIGIAQIQATKTETTTQLSTVDIPITSIETTTQLSSVTTTQIVISPTTTTQTSTIISSVSGQPYTVITSSSMTVMPSQVYSLWQAICYSQHQYCGSNYTSIPANVTSRLGLYMFFIVESDGNKGGGYDITNITVDLSTGLPEQPIVEPFPDGVVVDSAVPTSLGTSSCVMYMLIWLVSVPSNIPHGGSSWTNAINGQGLNPRDLSMGLTCPPANVTATTLPSSSYG